MTIHEKIQALEKEVKSEVLERNEEIGTAVLALISRTHHFQLGPPGIAKSLLVDRIRLRIADATYFHWLLTRFTTPEEVFGPPDIHALKEDGVYRRKTSGKLPTAHIAFWDEIFKASSSILNAGLTAMNERKFFNPGDDPHIPLGSMFSASNELPESEELAALWDRLHFRHEVKPLQQASSVAKMMTTTMDPAPATIITIDELLQAQQEATTVHVTDDILEGLIDLKAELSRQGVNPTDRRWKESIGILKAAAWLRGGDAVEPEDVSPLVHVLWDEVQHKTAVQKTIYTFSSPYDVEAMEILHFLDELRKEVDDLKLQDIESKASDKAAELYQKHERVAQDLINLRDKVVKAGKKSDLMGDAFGLWQSNTGDILKYFGIDPEGISETLDAAMADWNDI